MQHITSSSARQLARRIRAGELTALQVHDAFAERIGMLNPALNAIVNFDPETSRAEARRADARIAAGYHAPLLGVPYTVKDNIWVAGRVVSQGSALFADFVAPRDALAVKRMRDAGAVLLGITNCSEFACMGITTNRIHGPTRNPWDLTLTSGGSSGGAASAVAAGLCPIAITTDGGGSTRRPAALVGAVGMKPSAGLIAHPYGFEEPVFGNSVIGQIARTVGDVAAVLDVVAGPDRADPASVGARGAGHFAEGLCGDDGKPRRIAFSARLGLGFAVDFDVAQTVRSAIARLEASGATIEEADPSWPENTSEQALMPLQLAGLAAIYGKRFRDKPWDIDPDIAVQIEAGLKTTGAEVARALLLREELYRRLDVFFDRFDLLITPTVPCVAWPLTQLGPGEIEGRPATARGHAVFTPIFNHTYLPACSVPCGVDRNGLPIGLQIVGPRFADASVLALASRVEAQNEVDFSMPRTPAHGATARTPSA